MKEGELRERIKALQKALNNNAPPDAISALILQFLKLQTPSEDLLRTTKAGVILGKLRTHDSRDISRAAGEVVNRWRRDVNHIKEVRLAATKAQASGSPAAAAVSVSSSSPASVPAVTPKQAATMKRQFVGDPEKRTHKLDLVNVDRTDSNIRNQCIGLLYNGLAYRSTESPDVIVERAIEVEKAGFETYEGEGQNYRAKIRSLFQNLKVKTNPQLGKDVLSGAIPATRFVVMTREELMSAEMLAKQRELELVNLKNSQAPMAEKSVSDSLQCGNCKARKVSYSQAQTRSADEPMTTFCECMNCGKRWKFS